MKAKNKIKIRNIKSGLLTHCRPFIEFISSSNWISQIPPSISLSCLSNSLKWDTHTGIRRSQRECDLQTWSNSFK